MLFENVIILHPVALCNFDLEIMMPSGATAVYIEGPLLEGIFFVIFHCMKTKMAEQKTTQSGLNRNTQRSHIQNHKIRNIRTRNLRLKQSATLQQQQQPYPVTPEDGQLGRNMQ
jgi:hypothetical protein